MTPAVSSPPLNPHARPKLSRLALFRVYAQQLLFSITSAAYYCAVMCLPWSYFFAQGTATSTWAGLGFVGVWLCLQDLAIAPFLTHWLLLLFFGHSSKKWFTFQFTWLPGAVFGMLVPGVQFLLHIFNVWPFPFSAPISGGVLYSTALPFCMWLALPTEVTRTVTINSSSVTPNSAPSNDATEVKVSHKRERKSQTMKKLSKSFLSKYLAMLLVPAVPNAYYFLCLFFLYVFYQTNGDPILQISYILIFRIGTRVFKLILTEVILQWVVTKFAAEPHLCDEYKILAEFGIANFEEAFVSLVLPEIHGPVVYATTLIIENFFIVTPLLYLAVRPWGYAIIRAMGFKKQAQEKSAILDLESMPGNAQAPTPTSLQPTADYLPSPDSVSVNQSPVLTLGKLPVEGEATKLEEITAGKRCVMLIFSSINSIICFVSNVPLMVWGPNATWYEFHICFTNAEIVNAMFLTLLRLAPLIVTALVIVLYLWKRHSVDVVLMAALFLQKYWMMVLAIFMVAPVFPNTTLGRQSNSMFYLMFGETQGDLSLCPGVSGAH